MDGSAKLAAIGAKLRVEANGAMRRKVAATLRAEARPLATKTSEQARRALPTAGGLNDLVADRHVTISVLMGAQTAGVRMRKRDAASYQTDRGYIYHKTYGEKPWCRQEIPQALGWWTKTLTDAAPEVAPALLALIDRTAVEIGAV